jgi:uncharacterized protein with HEPN domain
VPRTAQERIRDILEAVEEIEGFVTGMSQDTFVHNRMAVRAVTLDLIVIGEAAEAIPDSVREAVPEIPWHAMYGMRNRLVHGYYAVDEQILWETVTNDLLPLKEPLSRLV